MVDARITEAFASGKVNTTEYPGITPEYLAESRDHEAVGAIIFLLCLTSVIVALRCFSRIYLVKSFGLDDTLAVVGFSFFVAFTVLSLVLIGEGSGRHLAFIQYILTTAQVNSTEVNDYVAHLVYTTALFICRLSGLAFFHRLCTRHETLIRLIYIAVVFLVCAFLPQFFLILFHCHPVTGLWPYAWQASAADYTCLNWGVVYVTNSALSLVCDFVIFTIPIAILYIIKLSKERKIMLAGLLLPGTVVIVISCVRLWLCISGQFRADGSWFYNPQLAIEVAEIGGTLIALSIPGLKALIGTVYDRMRSTIDHTYQSSGRGRVTLTKASQAKQPDHFQDLGHIKTSINARASSRGSDSDEDLLASMGSRDIFVQRDFVQQTDVTSIPMAYMKRKNGSDMV